MSNEKTKLGIPYGTIKRFTITLRNSEVRDLVGVYLEKEKICDIDGKEYDLNNISFSNIITSTVRLKPEVRETLETLHNVSNEYELLKRQQSDLYIKACKARDTYEQTKKKLANLKTRMSVGVTVDDCLPYLKKICDKFKVAELFPNAYYSSMYSCDDVCVKNGCICADIDFYLIIDKYINPERYKFVYREYDGCLFVESKLVPKELIAKYSNNYLSMFEKGLVRANVNFGHTLSDLSFSVGDKNSLCASQYLTLTIKNKDEFNQFANIVSKL